MKHHDYGDFFEWGLQNGSIVHIDKVKNGIACNCICPSCEAPLIAVNRIGNKRINHFKHQSKTGCNNSYETALHYLAKEIIQETKQLIVPDVYYDLSSLAQSYYNTYQKSDRRVKKSILRFDKVELEKNLSSFRPDLKCYIGNKVLLIEIAVTHFIDEYKRGKVLKNQTPLLEIDLSEFEREIHKEKLTEILNGAINNMKWIHNPKIESRKKESSIKASKIEEFIRKNVIGHKVYGKKEDIYDCPIFKGIYDKIQVKHECFNCPYYVEEYEPVYQTGDEEPKYPMILLNCIGHKSEEFNSLLKSLDVKIIS